MFLNTKENKTVDKEKNENSADKLHKDMLETGIN